MINLKFSKKFIHQKPVFPEISEETKRQWLKEYHLLQERGKRKEKLEKIFKNVD